MKRGREKGMRKIIRKETKKNYTLIGPTYIRQLLGSIFEAVTGNPEFFPSDFPVSFPHQDSSVAS
jgi:hypothetical protein